MNRPPRARRRPVAWPLAVALTFVAAVFTAGAIWSFREQTALADAAGFHVPWLLPLTLDGFAVAMAAVAWSASLDGRAALAARVGVGLGVVGTAASNGAWAWQRSGGDELTVTIAAGVPVLTMLAFEVLLAEVRRQVQRHRGLPRPVPVPSPRLVALLLAPWSTFTQWRRLTLERVSPIAQFAQLSAEQGPAPVAGPVRPDTAAPRLDMAPPAGGHRKQVHSDAATPSPVMPRVDVSGPVSEVRPDISTGEGEQRGEVRPDMSEPAAERGEASVSGSGPDRSRPAGVGQRPAHLLRSASRPAAKGRRRLAKPRVSAADRAREVLAQEPDITRAELAQRLGVSERHIRRVMSGGTQPVSGAGSGPVSASGSGPAVSSVSGPVGSGPTAAVNDSREGPRPPEVRDS